jgi:hypothetical protein
MTTPATEEEEEPPAKRPCPENRRVETVEVGTQTTADECIQSVFEELERVGFPECLNLISPIL